MITLFSKAATIIVLVFLATAVQAAEGDTERGRQIAYSCLGCHGIEGYRNAYPSYRVPKLGGQKAAYLVVALEGYKAGSRQHTTMQGQEQSLSEKDIADVSAYLATLNAEGVTAGGSGAPAFDKAAACAACHGQNGISVNATWPTLAGQYEDYLLKSLRQYRDGTRTDPVMSAQAALIAEEDVARLARYFAGLDGLATTDPE